LSTKIASLFAEIGADTSKLEAGTKKTRGELDKTASAFAKFSAEQTKQAKSFLAVENQKQKALRESERVAARMAKEAAKAAEIQRRNSLILAPGIEKAKTRVEELIRANAGLISVATGVATALVGLGMAAKNAYGAFQNYAQDVRDLSIASGTGAEEASRLLQVLDDYQITAEDITTAARAMKEKGIVPTVDTLAQLSDQFLAIEDPAKRLEFAQDNLGGSYSKYLNVLSQGGDKLRENARLVNDNLVLTDEQIRQSELARLAIDDLGGSWEGLKVKVGGYFATLVANSANHKEVIARLKEQGVQVYRGIEYTQVYKDELRELQNEQLAVSKSSQDMGEGLEETVDPTQAAADAARKLSGVYTGLLSSMFSIQKENKDYLKSLTDLDKEDQKLAEDKAKLTLEMGLLANGGKGANEKLKDMAEETRKLNKEEKELGLEMNRVNQALSLVDFGSEEYQQLIQDSQELNKREQDLTQTRYLLTQQTGDLNNLTGEAGDKYIELVGKMAELTEKEEENKNKREDIAKGLEEAGKQRVFDLTQERLAADGVIDSGEFEYLQTIAVQKGLVSRAAADQAVAESKAADALIANFARTQPTMEQTLATMQQIAGFNGTVVNFGVNFKTSGSTPSAAGALPGFNPQAAPGGYGHAASKKRDSGGSGVAGEPYMIGTGAQPEMFVPNTNGTFVPNADKKGFGNKTIVINITNPKKETAENSIRASLKKLSYVGVAA